jgi:deoxycytidine triphosphate deaminase
LSVLSEQEIKRRLELTIDNPESIVITPLLEEKFDRDSVDVRLGSYFRLPAVSSVPCLRPYRATPEEIIGQYPELVHKPYRENESGLIVQPHHSVLASTLEYIKMPGDVSGEVLTKSSWARVFVSIASAPWIHPFYRGCLTLEITNLGNVPVELPIGEPIAHLVFIKLEKKGKIKKDIIEGSYAGAVMPEAPTFRG